MFSQSLLAQTHDYPAFLDRIDPDMIGVVMILAVIFTFATVIVTLVVSIRTYQNVTLAKMTNRMIEDLVAKGYSLNEVERLVYGPSKWDSMKRMFARAVRRPYPRYVHRPVPPVKEAV